MEFNIFLGVAALVIAAVLTWCILRFFFAPRREAPGRRCVTAFNRRPSRSGVGTPRYRHDASRHSDHAEVRSEGDRRMHVACRVS